MVFVHKSHHQGYQKTENKSQTPHWYNIILTAIPVGKKKSIMAY